MDLRQAINFLNTVKSHPYTYRPNSYSPLEFRADRTIDRRRKRDGAMSYPIGQSIINIAMSIKPKP